MSFMNVFINIMLQKKDFIYQDKCLTLYTSVGNVLKTSFCFWITQKDQKVISIYDTVVVQKILGVTDEARRIKQNPS